jgi:hypothetical protein
MAKKNVVIFDGEDKFINPKKAVYSKTRGQAKKIESFKSLRAALMDEEGPNQSYSEQVADAPYNQGSVYSAPAVESQPSSGGNYEPTNLVAAPISVIADDAIPNISLPPLREIPNPFISQPSYEETRNAEYIERPVPIYVAPTPELPSNPYYDDRKTIMPIYEAPPQYVSQPITQEPPAYAAPIYEDERRIITPAFPSFPINETPVPIYNAPTPELPSNPYLDDRKTIMPIYEAPPISISRPITEEPPSYVAPRLDDVYDGRRPPRFDDPANPPSLDARNPIYYAPVPPSNDGPDKSCPEGMRLSNGTCIPITKVLPPQFDDRYPTNPIFRGEPVDGGNPYQPNPIYTAPVPILPNRPPARIIEDPMGGGGSPVMGGPEIPRPKCPTGFVFNDTTGMCIDKRNPDTEIDPIETPRTTSSTTSTTTKAAAAVPTTTSSTTSTTTKAAAAVPTTTSSTTTTTTVAIVDKICNPPIYAAPKYYKWVSKGNCAYELVVDDKQLIDAAPAPVLPATGQPIININIPTGTTGGGLGTIPTTSTTVQTTTKSLLPKGEDSGGSGGGGGGGSPFPEEPAPTGLAPKKNYFWWYVGGAMAIYLLMKRKNKQ